MFACVFACVGCGSDYHFVVPGQQGAEACHDPGARKDRGISTSLSNSPKRKPRRSLLDPGITFQGGLPVRLHSALDSGRKEFQEERV